MKKLIALVLLAIILLTGCSIGNVQANTEKSISSTTVSSRVEIITPVELTVSAAASLTDCMKELGALYCIHNPHVTLSFNYGSSGALQQQIEQGAPVDVFISAGKKQMTMLQDAGMMNDATVRDRLQNSIVLIAPIDAQTKPQSFEALAEANVMQIGVGESSSVPVGQYTQEIFEKLGLTDVVAPKLVFAKDAREVLAWVESGNVQAGIVYETDAKTSDKVTVCAFAPEGSHKAVVYPLGVVKSSKNSAEASDFVDFIATAEAGELFEKYGFTLLI